MQKVLIGEKAGMSRVYDDQNESIPVTVIESEDCVVVRKRTVNDHPSIQLGFRETNDANKPEQGHFEKNNVSPREVLQEFILTEDSPITELDSGERVEPDIFVEGQKVDVTGKTKGRGFSGAMRRWNFSGGPKTHGGGFGRSTGSVGQSADPSRIFPGKKMPGQYGQDVQTVQNLEVVRVLPDDDLIFVSGSIPGADGWSVIISNSIKEAEPVG